uniref:Uncharacterized protein n=1 Tax=Trypanosoma congolense (strain IL3000) TaxID=1068625 RepID=G0UQY1_TRYCI|nr:conserved hypothetical protein [Trypanosoma congolense IL3000]
MLRKAITKPFTTVVLSMSRKIDHMDEPLKHHIEEHYRSGEDLCANVWQEYWSYQRRLLSYRWKRLSNEMTYIREGNISMAVIDVKGAILCVRVLTKCLFLFLIFTILGRRSVFPTLDPDSPFVEELEANRRISS